MRSLTRRKANYSPRGGGVADGTSRGRNATKNVATQPPASKTPGKKILRSNYLLFIFYFGMRRY